ncbi:hypothetical protein CDAR_174291 [Caerostris darwini]|uniref:Uncharacterized protein n=1 Tax=Caerostris darwini TaxID=1538125 RepID=A0AAV4VK13_9ARAC|nr:hypothetical protein CDAR_174291 [Caerostris darwini]
MMLWLIHPPFSHSECFKITKTIKEINDAPVNRQPHLHSLTLPPTFLSTSKFVTITWIVTIYYDLKCIACLWDRVLKQNVDQDWSQWKPLSSWAQWELYPLDGNNS